MGTVLVALIAVALASIAMTVVLSRRGRKSGAAHVPGGRSPVSLVEVSPYPKEGLGHVHQDRFSF